MIKIFNARFFVLMCCTMSSVLIGACKKSDKPVNKVELLSFGPAGVMPGDTLRFIGTNLNQVTEINLTGATIPQSSFIKQGPELILVSVPVEAEQGLVTLKTPLGDLISKTKLNLRVVATVTSFTPEARPGENITVKGQYLNWINRITFANNKIVVADSFVSKSSTELIVKVPLDARTGPLIFSYGGTDPKNIEMSDTLKVTLPVIIGIAPNPVLHGSDLTITGTNLDISQGVLFTGVTTAATSFVSKSATQLMVQVPAGTKKGKISIVTASGINIVSSQDLDVILPSIISLSPNPVSALANLTITGDNLDLVTGISFAGVGTPVTTFISQSKNQIILDVPAGASTGKIILSVANSTLTILSANDLIIN